jgi:hypothetical protein
VTAAVEIPATRIALRVQGRNDPRHPDRSTDVNPNINLEALKAERDRLKAEHDRLKAEHDRWDSTATKATEAREAAKVRMSLLDKLIRLGELYVSGGGEEPIPF